MADQTNDDLLNELNSIPAPEKKKKKKAKKAADPVPEEPKTDDTPKDTPAPSNDDLLNDIESTESKPKKKSKKKKGQAEPAPEEEPKKEEPKKEEPKPTEAPKEEEPKEEGEEDNKEEEQPKEGGEKKKVVKKVKKVVKKKKKGKEDLMIKMLQEKKRLEEEREQQLIKEAEERERRQREEEERLRKEEEERLKKEQEAKEAEEKRLAELKKMGIKASDLAKLDENKKRTEEMLKQQGTSLDDFLNSLNQIPMGPKKKKPKKKKGEDKKENNNKEENVQNEEAQNTNEISEKPIEEGPKATVHQEIAGEVDDDKKFTVADNNEDIDDWENEVDDADEKEEEEKPKEEEDELGNGEIKPTATEPEKEDTKPSDNKPQKRNKQKQKETIPKEISEIDNMNLRAPIVCILGHVDTGKTKILDKLRRSNVQGGEAGGITQQIGATFLPIENWKGHLEKLNKKFQVEPKIPGILLIDTPGHASFQNLRSRGSSLCDIAVLIINIMKGIEKQTLEALDLLRQRKTPFIIALNQFDRVYQWKPTEWGAYRDSYDKQKKSQKKEFDNLVQNNITQLIKNNLNTALYDNNTSMKEYINLVPTSAITGEGMPDLLGLLLYLSQKFLVRKIEFKEEVQCTILEVKVLEGIGTTVDVILVNGTLNVGDKIIVGGLFGPIKTQIKIILTPHAMKEMRVKCEYDRHDTIKGAIGVKLFCPDLENALAGSPLYVYKTEEEAEEYAKEITKDFNSIVKDFLSKTGKGIMVQASTLGSLEAILTYLHEQKISVSCVGVGNLNKKDVIKMQTTHAQQENPLKEDLVILSFDNKVIPEAQQFADANGIKIFNDDVIYHLFDSYIEYKKECQLERKKAKEKEAIFPCMLKTVMFINKKDPLIIGVDVVEGILKIGTPLYCPEKKLPIGVVEGMEKDHKPINNVKPVDGSVSIRLRVFDSSLTAGRHFDEKCTFVAQITRNSIDALKEFFREDMTQDDWKTVIKLKKILEIQ